MKLSKVSLNQDILLAGSDLPKLDPLRVCVCVCAGGGSVVPDVFLITVTGSR